MAISGIGATPEPQKNGGTQEQQNIDDKKASIFDYDKDGTITVEEQKQALENRITIVYEEFKNTLDKYGFKLSEFKDKYTEKFKELVAKNDLDIRIAGVQINQVLDEAESEVLEKVKEGHNNNLSEKQAKLEDLKMFITSSVETLLMSYDLSESGKQKAEELKRAINELIIGQPELKEWGEDLIQKLASKL